ncbi:MAG: ABC transporter ATP-binding protein [Planctomycetota bacterium]
MIEVRNLHKAFGRFHALRGVGFDAPEGQVTGLLGANGAGKSTTIRVITGYTTPDVGWVRVGGIWPHRRPLAARRAIGYLPESAPAYPEMSTEAFLAYRASLYGIPRRTRRGAVERAIESCALGPVRRRRVGHLSKGYRQRAGLAAAILHDPRVLILDEPTNGLDPGQINETRSVIRRLAEGRTVLVSSHILPEIERSCDRVVILAAGRLCAQGSLSDLLGAADDELACEVAFPLAGTAEPARSAVARTPGVLSVAADEPGPKLRRWRVRFDAGTITEPDLRAVVGRTLSTYQAEVRLLERQTPTLERVFLALTEAASGDEGENREKCDHSRDDPGAKEPKACA